jgi:hypothetical protein
MSNFYQGKGGRPKSVIRSYMMFSYFLRANITKLTETDYACVFGILATVTYRCTHPSNRKNDDVKNTLSHTGENYQRNTVVEEMIFWDVAPCSMVDVYRSFISACYFHCQGSDDGGRHLHTRCRENLKSHTVVLYLWYYRNYLSFLSLFNFFSPSPLSLFL